MKLLFCAFASILVALVLVAGPVQAADRSVGEKLDDTKITTAVKTKLTTDRVKNLVDVGVGQGEVVPPLHAEQQVVQRVQHGVFDILVARPVPDLLLT